MIKYHPTEAFTKRIGLFKNLHFRFKGLTAEKEKQYIKIVKDLGAEVSNDASYTFIDQLNFEESEIRERSDLYNITYILDCIKSNEQLDINLYRYNFDDTLDENNELLMDVDKSTNLIQLKETENSFELIDNFITKYKNDQREKKKASSLKDSNLKEIKIYNNSENVTSYNSDKENLKKIESASESIDPINSITDTKLNKVKDTDNGYDSESSASEILIDNPEEERNYDKCKNWWQEQEVSDNNVCEICNCVFEPNRHEKHGYPRRLMSLTERRILIKYLIKTNSISQSKGHKIWYLMHDAGYLVHRTVESLRNCLRRTILPKIRSYGLPPDILNQFLNLNKNKKYKIFI